VCAWRTRQICRDGGCRKVKSFVVCSFCLGCGFAALIRHPGLVPGSTGRRGGKLALPAFRRRPGGSRNRSGVTKEGVSREDAKTRRRVVRPEARRTQTSLRHPGLVPGSTVRLGGKLELPAFRWRPGGPRNESGVTKEEWFTRRRGGRGGKSQGYCWRACRTASTLMASGTR
jgi:hypothetical protein